MRFAVGEVIEFADELGKSYTIQAIGPRFAICTRPADKEDFEHEETEFEEGKVVYSIVDSRTWKRGPDWWIFGGMYAYETVEGCQKALTDLESGECELSRRRSVDVHLVGDRD